MSSKWHESSDEEETLSLCDLPLGFTSDEESPLSTNPQDLEEEFEFGSWVGSISTENEMCAADEVFYKGQILPLRLSSSSGLTSRSSSLNSTTTSSSSVANNTNAARLNQFHTHPSPKPQIRVSGRSHGNRKASVWNLLRVGLVPTPEIGLQDLKGRNVNNNLGRGLKSNYGDIKKLKNLELKDEETKTRRERFMVRGCKCSVETVSCRVKSTTRSSSSKCKKGGGSGEGGRRAMQQQQQETIKQRHDVSHHRNRTSEWLMDLSHANSTHHETVALLA